MARKEIIVVDDGSTDQTLAVAKKFVSKDVGVVGQKHEGVSAARNRALSFAQGDYIQWLDADDILSPNKIRKQMEVAEESESDRILFSCGLGYFSHRAARAKFCPTPLWCDLTPVEWLLRMMGKNLHMQTATWLVSRELTEAAGPWNTRLLRDNDGEYFCRVILASEGIRFVPEARVLYRISPPSRVSNIGRSDKKREAFLLSMRLHVKYLQWLEDSERVRTACVTYLQNWLPNFYPERPDIVEELQKFAKNLGGRLETPRLRWKYAWIEPIFGYSLAKRAEILLPQLKALLIDCWDKTMYKWEECYLVKNLLTGSRDCASA